jgi:hypothetical protein
MPSAATIAARKQQQQQDYLNRVERDCNTCGEPFKSLDSRQRNCDECQKDPAAIARAQQRAKYLRRKAAGKPSSKPRTDSQKEGRNAHERAKRAVDGSRTGTRASIAELEARRAALYEIAEEQQPMTVRAVFYQMEVRGLVSKDKDGYTKVQQDLVKMRKDGSIPYEWFVDNTRRVIQPYTCSSIADALEDTADQYRKALWEDMDCIVQIWLEKDALAGVISPVTKKYDVPLMVVRGYGSLSFINDAAQALANEWRDVYVYHLGDHDPSGVNAAENIEETLKELAPTTEIHFERLAVTLAQMRKWRLPTRETKSSDPRAAQFGDLPSVELDAIAPNQLRKLVEDAILKHMSRDQYDELMEQEEAERKQIREFVDENSE